MSFYYGKLKKIGPNRWRVVHAKGVQGQVKHGNECAHCGKPRPKTATTPLCSSCNSKPNLRRRYPREV